MVNYACVYAMQVIDTWMHRVVVASWTIGVGVAPRSLLFPYMQRGLLVMGGFVRYLACAAVRTWCRLVGDGAHSINRSFVHSLIHSFIQSFIRSIFAVDAADLTSSLFYFDF